MSAKHEGYIFAAWLEREDKVAWEELKTLRNATGPRLWRNAHVWAPMEIASVRVPYIKWMMLGCPDVNER